jgi:hypothetical protein
VTKNIGDVHSCCRGAAKDLAGDGCGLRSDEKPARGGSEGHHGAQVAMHACRGWPEPSPCQRPEATEVELKEGEVAEVPGQNLKGNQKL